MPWTLSDAALHDSCARLSGQRNGVGLAARRLEQREARAPADETTLAALRAKHPAAGARKAAHVYDTEHAEVRRLAAAARARRVQAMPISAVTMINAGLIWTATAIRSKAVEYVGRGVVRLE